MEEKILTKGIFITATETDVGKTYVSALIVKTMRENKLNCGYYKPALSGAEEQDGQIIPGDCAYVFKRAEIALNPKDYVSYIFKPAVSPHLAAQIENNPIKLDKIINDFTKIKNEFDYLLVEGAGGIVCPFNVDENLILPDVIKALKLDIIVVASAELGAINSTVLTVEYARQKGINVKGIILNKYDENNFMQRDNKIQIEKLTGLKTLATVKENDDTIDLKEIKPVFQNIFDCISTGKI